MGQTLGGLVNATLGNAVELIVAILALVKVGSVFRFRTGLTGTVRASSRPIVPGRINLVQHPIGPRHVSSTTSHYHTPPFMPYLTRAVGRRSRETVFRLADARPACRCFFAGGVRFSEQTIKSTAAQLNASLLLIAVIAVLIPSAFHFSITTTPTGDGELTPRCHLTGTPR